MTDDRTICDERIAPMEATMIRSIWRIVRNAGVPFVERPGGHGIYESVHR